MASYCEQFARVAATVPAIRGFVTTHDIDGVRAPNDVTVVVRLNAPATDFLDLVALPYLSPIPVEYLDYLPDSPGFRQHTLSDGPYAIAQYIPNQLILLERNPVWESRTDPVRSAHVDRIRIRLGTDAQLQELQVEAGTADLGFEMTPPAALSSLLETGDPRLSLNPPGGVFGSFVYLDFNHIGPNNHGALARRTVRRAIALAIDKAAVVQLLGGPGVARPLRQAALSSSAGYRAGSDHESTQADRGDPAAARRLLAEAGFQRGLSLRLAFPTTSWNPLVAQALQASLARVGIDVRLVPQRFDDLYSRLLADDDHAKRGEWDLALETMSPDWFGENNGRSLVASMFDGRGRGKGAYNVGGYDSPAVNGLIDRAATAPTDVLAEHAWFETAQHVMEDVAFVPLAEYKRAYLRSSRVRNCTWAVFGLNCDLTALWLEGATKKAGGSR
jgi:peptide/nickel transport system substrate-binding protein